MPDIKPFDPDSAVKQLTIELKDSTLVVVPNDLSQITPYVLLEQEDWFEYELDFIRALATPSFKMLDIGANFGIYTLVAARKASADAKFWAIEPASTTADFLRHSIKANGFEHITVDQLALSDSVGEGFLTISNSPELNALAEEASENTEQVALSTLDQLLDDEFAGHQFDFVKLDAEGAEEAIIRGGKRFFAEQSPLVMFELKHGGTVNHDLIAAFNNIGYAPYVCVPGVNALRPFSVDEEVDGYQLNLFGCKPDRADELAARGLLIKELPAIPAEAPDWGTVVRLQPWATIIGGLWLQWGQQAEQLGLAQYRDAMSHWAMAKLDGPMPDSDGTSAPADKAQALRLAHLQQAFHLITTCPQYKEEDPPALVTGSRIAAELGQRTIQLNLLNRAMTRLSKGDYRVQMPLLAPIGEYDQLSLKGPLEDWLVATMIGTSLEAGAFSGFFTGTDHLLGRLQEIVKTNYVPIEVLRRAMLMVVRNNVNIEGDFPPMFDQLMTRTGEHRNAELWKNGFGKRFRDTQAEPEVAVEARHPGRTVRVVHSLARSGATIMCRCLSLMPQTFLFSEIHPLGPSMTAKLGTEKPERFNIAQQGREWFDIRLGEEFKGAQAGDNDEAVIVAVIDSAFDRERRPVVRDWSQLDFLGWQFTSNRSNRLTTKELLAKHYQPQAITIIRHPVTLLLSMAKGEGTREFLESEKGCEDFLNGYLKFLEATGDTPRFKYEEFTLEPALVLKGMCDALGLAFDPRFPAKLADNTTKLTGDEGARGPAVIKPNEPVEVSAAQIAMIESFPAYEAILEATDYHARDTSLFTVV